jgi:branched-chain amino acid transport system permease protein
LVLKVWRKIPLLLRRCAAVGFVAAVLLVINQFVEAPNSNRYAENVIVFIGINIILAVALNIVNGFTGQFSLGHIGFFAVGAYVAAALGTYGHDRLFSRLPVDGSAASVVVAAYPIVFMMLASGLAAAVIGLVVGLPSLRLRGDYLAIMTLGFAQIIQVVLLNLPVVDGATSFTGIERHGVFELTPHLTNFFWVYFVAAVVIWAAYGLRFSTHGLALMAVREDEVAAEAMGINTTKYKVIAFVVSAFFTGVAGALFGLYVSALTNDQFSFMQGINIVVMVVLGGLGSISGVAIAAVLLTGLPEVLRFTEDYRLVILPLLLILLMLTRPQGIFGRDELSTGWFVRQVHAVSGWFSSRRRPAEGAGR